MRIAVHYVGRRIGDLVLGDRIIMNLDRHDPRDPPYIAEVIMVQLYPDYPPGYVKLWVTPETSLHVFDDDFFMVPHIDAKIAVVVPEMFGDHVVLIDE